MLCEDPLGSHHSKQHTGHFYLHGKFSCAPFQRIPPNHHFWHSSCWLSLAGRVLKAPCSCGLGSVFPLPVVWGLRQDSGQWAQLGWVHLGFGPIRPVPSGHLCRRNPASGSSCTCRVASPHLPSVQKRAAHVGQGFSLSGIFF